MSESNNVEIGLYAQADALIDSVIRIAQLHKENIEWSSKESQDQIDKTKSTIAKLVELSKQIRDPVNKVCKEISSKAFSVIWDTVKNQELYFSQLKSRDETIESLNKDIQNLSHKAFYDQLTWLGNRYLFEKTFRQFESDFLENGITFSLAMLDIDDFKKINDTCSYEMWDKALMFFSEKLRKFFWLKWVLFRLWWEEFGFMAQIWENEMFDLLELFRKQYSKWYKIRYKDSLGTSDTIKLTFSWGVVWCKKKPSLPCMQNGCWLKVKKAKEKWKNNIVL